MSAFLNNLAAKVRGAVPRLEPRRPAPYEGLPINPVPDSLDPMPQTSGSLKQPSVPETAALSSSTIPAAPAGLPIRAVVIPASPHQPAPADSTLASNAVFPTPAATAPPTSSSAVVPTTTPVASRIVARRMAHTAPSAPSPLAATSLPSIQAQMPRPPAKDSPASSGGIELTAPVPPTVETLRPVIHAPQMPPVSKMQEPSLPTLLRRQESVPLTLLRGEVQIPRTVVPTSAHTPEDAAPTTKAPVIEVHIGTIEVVAVQPPPPMASLRVAAQPGEISLDDFLDGTNRQ